MKGFFRKLDQIDVIIGDGASPENAAVLISFLTDLASTAYALSLLDVTWLEPLESIGFFREDSSTEMKDQSSPREFWPASAYLKRIAKDSGRDPGVAQVLQRILSFMPTPKNYTIVRDMVEISVMLPREMRLGIVPVIQRVVSTADNIEFANVADLVNVLAEDGDVSAALRLFSTVFAVFRPEFDASRSRLTLEAAAFMDAWNYRQEMTKCLGPLTRAGGMRFLQCLCRILDEHLKIAAKGAFQGPDDFSYIWRPAIEDHGQNLHDDPRDSVITAIRECATTISSESPIYFSEIVEMMNAEQWFIFTRIALYLLAESPSASAALIEKYSTEPFLFSEVGVRHEYSLMLKKRFKMLDLNHQGAVLKMIENGPNQSSYSNWVQQSFKRSVTSDELRIHSRRWQYDWLSFIQYDLPEGWKDNFDELMQEFGEPEHPEFPSYTRSGFVSAGFGSRTSDSIEEFRINDLLEELKSKPSGLVRSEEELNKLAYGIKSVDEEDRATIMNNADEITLLPVPIIDAISSALLSTDFENEAANVPTALKLGVSIVIRAAMVGREGNRNALLEIATRIVDQLVPNRDSRITIEQLPMLRRMVTDMLSLVNTEDELKRKQPFEDFDPLTDAINSLNGRIVDAAVKVAFVERGLNSGGKPEEPQWLLSHLSAILMRLQPDEIRVSAIIGYRFPWLMNFSRSWAIEHVESIFPLSPEKTIRWMAAWYSYIKYSGAYDDVFEIMSAQYAKAIKEMAAKRQSKKSRRDYDMELGQHFAAYYWRGKLNIGDYLFERFMTIGTESAIGTLLSSIGRAIGNQSDVPPSALDALRDLAVWMVSKWTPNRRVTKKALAAFGWWFPHQMLGDPLWRLRLIQKVVKAAGRVQNPDQVLKTLEDLALDFPEQVVNCLHAFTVGSPDESTKYFLATRSETILERSAQHASAKTKELISEIADFFGSLGLFQFRRFANAA